jgi:hypothetical protein
MADTSERRKRYTMFPDEITVTDPDGDVVSEPDSPEEIQKQLDELARRKSSKSADEDEDEDRDSS